MKYLIKYKLYENIQQGKSILLSLDIPVSDTRWIRLLKIFDKNPGYIGDFTYLVFKKDWNISTIEYIYDNFINNQSNKQLFNEIYSKIKTFSEESFVDRLMGLKKDKDIKSVYNMFPALQKEIIDKSKNRDKILYDLSLRKDINSFIRKVSRYHTEKDLVHAANLFISSEILDQHDKIIKKIKEVEAVIIKDDESNNLVIIRVNFPQLIALCSHTSWCILNQGTFNSYNRVCDQYVIFFTDESGNKSMIGTTIGTGVKTSHYINDDFVSTSTLDERLKERGFRLSSLFMTDNEFLKKTMEKEELSTLLKTYTKDIIFSNRKVFSSRDYESISEEDIIKYDIKYIDDGFKNERKVINDYKNGRIAVIRYSVRALYKEFGNEIAPLVSKSVNFSKFTSELIELVEVLEGIKFTKYNDIIKRIDHVNETLIKFLIKREIPFKDEDIAKLISNQKYGNNYFNLISTRPQLFNLLKDTIKYLDSKEMEKLLEIDVADTEEFRKVIKDRKKQESAKYVKDILPSPRYQNMGIGRREFKSYLTKIGATVFGVNEFLNDDIWGRIKEFKLNNSYDSAGIMLYSVMALTKASRLNEIKTANLITTYEDVGKVIRAAMYREDSNFGYKYNGESYVSKEFYLNDAEQKKLFEWMLANLAEDDISANISNLIYDKTLGRHKAFSLIYYIYSWGFDRYMNIVSKVNPRKDEKWTEIDGRNHVTRPISRPELLEHVFAYLRSKNDIDEIIVISDMLLNMNLKKYEMKSLVYKATGYDKSEEIYSRLKKLFNKYSVELRYKSVYSYNSGHSSMEFDII